MRRYRSAQHALDEWARLTAQVRTVGAVDYEVDEVVGDSDVTQAADPSPMLDRRAELTSALREAKRRADQIQWAYWSRYRAGESTIPELPVEVPGHDGLDAETVALSQIRRVDDLVEQVLRERDMLVESYRDRRGDRTRDAQPAAAS